MCKPERDRLLAFDAIVAFGAVIRVHDLDRSVSEMIRITGTDSVVVASVMRVLGSLRYYLDGMPGYARDGRLDMLRRVYATGDNRYDVGEHPCQMFRWSKLVELSDRLGFQFLDASASNFLSAAEPTGARWDRTGSELENVHRVGGRLVLATRCTRQRPTSSSPRARTDP